MSLMTDGIVVDVCVAADETQTTVVAGNVIVVTGTVVVVFVSVSALLYIKTM